MSKLITLENIEALKEELSLKQPVNTDYFIYADYNDTEYFNIQIGLGGDSIEINSIKDIFDLIPALHGKVVPVEIYDPASDITLDTLATTAINIYSNDEGNFANISLSLLSGNGILYISFSELTSSEESQLEWELNWSEVHLNNSSGINYDNYVELTYGDTEAFNVVTDVPPSSVVDFVNFFSSYLYKQILMYIADSSEEKQSTIASIVGSVNYSEKESKTEVLFETPYGNILVTIEDGDSGCTFNVDWSRAVDWASKGGGGGGGSNGKIGYVATFDFPFIEEPTPKVSVWFTNAQIEELEELSGETFQDIIDHWDSIAKSMVIPILFDHSLQAKAYVWPDASGSKSYPCITAYTVDGEEDTELYFVYLDKNNQRRTISASGDDINSITLSTEEWTGGSSGGGGSGGSELSQDYLMSLSNKLGHGIYPIKKIIENSHGTTTEYDPQELQELDFNSTLYLRGDKFMPIIIPGSSGWNNINIEILDTSEEHLGDLTQFQDYLPQPGEYSSGDPYLILYLSINQEQNNIDPQEIIIYASHSEE